MHPLATLVVLMVVAFPVLAGSALRAAWRRRTLHRTPRRLLGEAREGVRARFVGAIELAPGEAALVAPVSGRRCVYYRVAVEEYGRRGQVDSDSGDDDHGRVVFEEVRGQRLVLRDRTGYAYVDLEGAALTIDRDAGLRSAPIDERNPATLAWLERTGLVVRRSVGSPRLRYREAALELGAELAVIGVGVREADPHAAAAVVGYRDAPPTRLHFASTPQHPVVVTDTPAAMG